MSIVRFYLAAPLNRLLAPKRDNETFKLFWQQVHTLDVIDFNQSTNIAGNSFAGVFAEAVLLVGAGMIAGSVLGSQKQQQKFTNTVRIGCIDAKDQQAKTLGLLVQQKQGQKVLGFY